MASQQPQPEKMPFKQKVEVVEYLAQCACLPVIAITRWDVGYRILNPLHLICTTLALLMISGLIQDQTKRPIDLAVFAVFTFIAAFCQKFIRWLQIGKVPQHTYYPGTSCLSFHWLPEFMTRNRRIERFIDPLAIFGIGLIIYQGSPALGMWIMVSSLCIRLYEYGIRQYWLHTGLDVADNTFKAESMSALAERYTTPAAQNRQQSPAGDLATGLGDDIQHKIKGRKAKQRTAATEKSTTRPKRSKRQQVILALFIAVLADVLQCPYHGTTVSNWVFIPGERLNAVTDVVVLACVIRLLGFRWIILPTFLLELIPRLDCLPFWTAYVAYMIWRRTKAPANTPPPQRPEPEQAEETPPPPPSEPPQKPPLSDLEIEPEAAQPETPVKKRQRPPPNCRTSKSPPSPNTPPNGRRF